MKRYQSFEESLTFTANPQMMDQEATAFRAPFQSTGLFAVFLKKTITIQVYRNSQKMFEKFDAPKTRSYFFLVFFQAWHAGAGCWAGNLREKNHDVE